MLNKNYSLNHTVYLVGLHIYYKMIHGPYNAKLLSPSASELKATLPVPSNPVTNVSYRPTTN